MTTTGKRQCRAQNRRGEPCSAPASDSGFCFWHDPARVQERAAARAKGGHARHGRQIGSTDDEDPVSIQTMADVVSLLERTLNDVLRLENSIQRARTIGSLASVIIKALEFATLEERVEALERALGGRDG